MHSSLGREPLLSNGSHASGTTGSKRNVVYEAKAQLFRPTGGGETCEECAYVSAVTVQVRCSRDTVRPYGHDSAQYTLSLLTAVAPMQAGPAPFESTTPTGAAVLATIVDTWCPMPPMTVTAVGKGAGGRDSDQVANVLRLVLGSPA